MVRDPARGIVRLGQETDVADRKVWRERSVRHPADHVQPIRDAELAREPAQFANARTVADEHGMEGQIGAERDRMEQLPAETAAEPGVPGEMTLDPDGERVGEAEPLA